MTSLNKSIWWYKICVNRPDFFFFFLFRGLYITRFAVKWGKLDSILCIVIFFLTGFTSDYEIQLTGSRAQPIDGTGVGHVTCTIRDDQLWLEWHLAQLSKDHQAVSSRDNPDQIGHEKVKLGVLPRGTLVAGNEGMRQCHPTSALLNYCDWSRSQTVFMLIRYLLGVMCYRKCPIEA